MNEWVSRIFSPRTNPLARRQIVNEISISRHIFLLNDTLSWIIKFSLEIKYLEKNMQPCES